MSGKSTKKTQPRKRVTRDGMRAEYDFSGGVRGNYAEQARDRVKVVLLDADVARVFKDSASVNHALRALIGALPKPKRKPVRPAWSGTNPHARIPMAGRLQPVHPGAILFEDFLKPFGLPQSRVAREISVPPRRINEIVHGKRAITADTALRLARFFGTSDRFWLNLQTAYDLDVERNRLARRLTKEVEILRRAS